MDKMFKKLTAEDVLLIFKEEHRLCSPLDVEADPTIELTMDSSIDDWRVSMDLLQWRKLSRYLNEEFEINVTELEWKSVLEPACKKKLCGVCELISKHALIEIIKPIKTFEKECLSASIFKTIKRNLSKRGVDTSGLKPSSLIEPYLKNNFGEFLEQINKNFTGVIPEIIMTRPKLTEPKVGRSYSWLWSSFILSIPLGIAWNPILFLSAVLLIIGVILEFRVRNEFMVNNEMIYIPGINTFRDLVETIIEKKYSTQQ